MPSACRRVHDPLLKITRLLKGLVVLCPRFTAGLRTSELHVRPRRVCVTFSNLGNLHRNRLCDNRLVNNGKRDVQNNNVLYNTITV